MSGDGCRCESDAEPSGARGWADAGSASLVVVSMIGVLVLLGLGAAFMTATAAAHRRAQAGADLAALAGATAGQQGSDPCVAAVEVAAANHAELTSCLPAGDDVVVAVRVEGPEFLGHTFEVIGRARAGPSP
ncbi:Rv3654c family TadE-like protein [Nocardioides jensenii]|uniref:Rv3654c family TadE-like protein n=1 Tax=Nocardioides jensenii TaxID=1843 RepID=UPI0009E7B404|nr:Rv3654c family TadE-like protein [Nocardioides jensenii]